MNARYMALLWRDDTSRAEAYRIANDVNRRFELSERVELARGLILASKTSRVARAADRGGVVIGDIYQRSSCPLRANPFDGSVGKRIGETGGDSLIGEFWGDYVAVLFKRQEPAVLRDPLGGLSCYVLRYKDIDIVLSEIEFATALGLIDGEVDWPSLRHWLAQPGLRTDSTCIRGVSEIPPGVVWTRSGASWRYRAVWSPWDFAAADRQFTDREDAVTSLRYVALLATRVLAVDSNAPLLEMSGGLDSSIVAACLRRAGANVRCVSLWSADPGADERQYARAVADHIEAPVRFAMLTADDVDITDLASVPAPRPIDHPLKRASDIALEEEGVLSGADCFFSGSGGDCVLGYLASSAPAADALMARGPGPTFFNAASDVAELHACSIWKAGALAARKAWGGGGRKAVSLRDFLSPDLSDVDAQTPPWLAAPPTAWPGKQEQIDSLARFQGVREERNRRRVASLKMPLLSQPVVETCLRIPSWMSVAGGRNRAVARDAFAGDLPESILKRRTKGNFTSFNAAIFERNRRALREILLDGRLNAEGVLDRRALENYFAAGGSLADNRYASILDLASAELWTRNWR